MPDPEPRRGAVAACSLGHIGLITSSEPVEVTYRNGDDVSVGLAWTGVHVVPPLVGVPWSSRNPHVVGYLDLDALAGITVDESLREAQ